MLQAEQEMELDIYRVCWPKHEILVHKIFTTILVLINSLQNNTDNYSTTRHA